MQCASDLADSGDRSLTPIGAEGGGGSGATGGAVGSVGAAGASGIETLGCLRPLRPGAATPGAGSSCGTDAEGSEAAAATAPRLLFFRARVEGSSDAEAAGGGLGSERDRLEGFGGCSACFAPRLLRVSGI